MVFMMVSPDFAIVCMNTFRLVSLLNYTFRLLFCIFIAP